MPFPPVPDHFEEQTYHPDDPMVITRRQWDSLLELVACTHNTVAALAGEKEEEDHGSLPSV